MTSINLVDFGDNPYHDVDTEIVNKVVVSAR